MNSDIRFYISVFLRRFHYFLLPALVIAAAGIATAIVLPEKYDADAILLVESAQIPGELAASTVQQNPQEQLEILRQRLLARPTLLEIARENGVFASDTSLFPDQIVDRMRGATSFDISTGRDRASLVTIRFRSERPTTAAAVVNAYVTEVLEQNVEVRTGRAEGTKEFFEQEVDRLSDDLARISADILEFKNANIDALPENLNYQLSRIDDLRDAVASASREIQSLGQQRERLILVFNATGGGEAGRDLRSPAQRDLAEAEAELEAALLVLSDQNPRVKALRARIANLQKAVDQQAGDEGGGVAPETMLDVQLKEIDSRVASLAEQMANTQNEIARLESSVARIPTNSVTLESLEREYQNIQENYSRAVQSASQAETGERIELLSKGERISVLSQPVVPREPASPNRPLIVGAGAFLGIAAGLGLVLLLELTNSAVRRPVDLTKTLGIAPLSVIPLIRTPREMAIRRAIVSGVIVFGTILAAAAIIYVHTQIKPLDLLATRALNDLGF